MAKTAVVILNYNGREWLRRFLPAVVQFSQEAHIVVADNASTDDSTEIVRNEFPSVELIEIPTNLGFAGGYNYALKKTTSEYVVLLNSDVEVTQRWLEPLVRLLDSRPDVAAVQPKILSHADKTHFEYAGAGGGFIDFLGYPFCRGRIFDSIEEDSGQYNDTRLVFWASGACMALRAAAYHDVGGLDEDFFAHMEEIDLCWKFHRAGLGVGYTGESTVYHVGGGTLSKSNPRKTYLNFRNGLSLMVKHERGAQLVWKLPWRVLLDWIAALIFVVRGSGRNGWAVIIAHADFFRNFSRDMNKRRLLLTRFGFVFVQIYPRSIVADYFLRGKRKFTETGF